MLPATPARSTAPLPRAPTTTLATASTGTAMTGTVWAGGRRARHTWSMKSTMQDAPLLISDILRHGKSVHGDSTVITVEPGGTHRQATFSEVATRAEKLAAALTRLGV